MRLPGSIEKKVTKDKTRKDIPHLQIIEVVLVPCKIINNHYQQESRILYKFNPNK